MNPLKRTGQRIIDSLVHSATRAYHQDFYYSAKWHPHRALLEEALAETVDYIKSDMSNAMIKADAYDVLDHASASAPATGLMLEFGVRTGTSVNHLARRNPTRTIHGFDSFEGLPEDWSGWTQDRGAFGREDIPAVDANVELTIGWFDDTLPEFLDSHPGDLALAHIDSDIYSSAKTVLDNLCPRVKPGSIIVFNEYFNYPNWKQHEFKAFQEFCVENSVEYEYLSWAMYEVAVRILDIDARPTTS